MLAFLPPPPLLVAVPPGITINPAVQAARFGNPTEMPLLPENVNVTVRQVESVGTSEADAGI